MGAGAAGGGRRGRAARDAFRCNPRAALRRLIDLYERCRAGRGDQPPRPRVRRKRDRREGGSELAAVGVVDVGTSRNPRRVGLTHRCPSCGLHATASQVGDLAHALAGLAVGHAHEPGELAV
jgi:hypothetical protein